MKYTKVKIHYILICENLFLLYHNMFLLSLSSIYLSIYLNDPHTVIVVRQHPSFDAGLTDSSLLQSSLQILGTTLKHLHGLFKSLLVDRIVWIFDYIQVSDWRANMLLGLLTLLFCNSEVLSFTLYLLFIFYLMSQLQ